MSGETKSGTSPGTPRKPTVAVMGTAVLALVLASAASAYGEGAVSIGKDGADGSALAVAMTGDAHSSGGVAISGTGTANGAVVAASGTGTAWTTNSSGIGVSGTGRSDGPGTDISGEAYVLNTGLLSVATTAEQAAVPLTDTVDPMDTANKLQLAAETAPAVAYNLATGVTQFPTMSSSMSTTSSPCPDGTCNNPPMDMHLNQAMIAQERWYYCVPASAQMFLSSAGVSSPSQDTLAQRLGTTHPTQDKDPKAGTPIENVPAVVNNIRRSGDRIIIGHTDSSTTFMSDITADIYNYHHTTFLSLNPSRLRAWSGHGTSHAVVAYGYNHRNNGTVLFMDPYDYTRFNWDQQSWRGPNPGGAHEESLNENVWPAVHANGGKYAW